MLESGHIILDVDSVFPLMSFESDKGEIVGFDIDRIREVSNMLVLR